jgi:large subunit ribosomal protein L17
VTTVAKAKETRMLVEKMITRAKHAAVEGTTPAAAVHARREVGRMIKDRTVIKELFTTIAEKVATRPGGYTRIVRLGQRPGDGADVAVLELVDFNTGQATAEKTPAPAKKKKAATRPRSKKAAAKAEAATGEKDAKNEKK